MLEPGNAEGVRPASIGATAAVLALTAAFAFAAAALREPVLAVAAALALGALTLAYARFGRDVLVLALLALVPLIPATDAGALAALGDYGTELRAPLIAGALILSCFLLFPELPRPANVRTTRIVAAFALLAGAGAFATLLNSETPAAMVDEAIGAVGQPLIYALALIVFAQYARRGPRHADLLLAAFCTAVILEAGYVALELASGSAFDALRGVTRAQGTLGSNFLSALGALGFLAALALWERRPDPAWRRFAALAMVAGLAVMFAGISRGAVIALIVAGAYLLLTSDRLRPGPTIVALCAGGALAFAFASLWADSFEEGVTEFDRTQTWIAGLRISADNPVAGLGSDGVVDAIETRPDYYDTPFGKTTVIPHNMWILGFAESGILYFLALVVLAATVTWAIASRPRPPSDRRAPGERALVAAVIAFGILAAINNMFTHPELAIGVLAFLAILLTPEARAEAAPAIRESG